MRRTITGQILLIICCIFYMIWWYRCYRPGEAVNRVGGVNGILLLSTAAFGIAGVVLSLTEVICNLNAAGGLTDRDFTILVEKCGI